MPPKTTPADVKAIEARVNEVINSALSRAFEERDRLTRTYVAAGKTAESLGARLDALNSRVSQSEEAARRNEVHGLRELERLKDEAEQVLSLLATVNDAGAGEYAAMVGKQVTLVGGAQVMVAAGLDDAGDMLCVFERSLGSDNVEIQRVAVPPRALALVKQPRAAPAAKAPSKARRARPV